LDFLRAGRPGEVRFTTRADLGVLVNPMVTVPAAHDRLLAFQAPSPVYFEGVASVSPSHAGSPSPPRFTPKGLHPSAQGRAAHPGVQDRPRPLPRRGCTTRFLRFNVASIPNVALV